MQLSGGYKVWCYPVLWYLLPILVVKNSHLLLCLPCWDGQDRLKITRPCYSVHSQVSLSSFDKVPQHCCSSSFPFILASDCPLPTPPRPQLLPDLFHSQLWPLHSSWEVKKCSMLPLSFLLLSSSFCIFTFSFFPHFPSHIQRIYWESFMCQAQCSL